MGEQQVSRRKNLRVNFQEVEQQAVSSRNLGVRNQDAEGRCSGKEDRPKCIEENPDTEYKGTTARVNDGMCCLITVFRNCGSQKVDLDKLRPTMYRCIP